MNGLAQFAFNHDVGAQKRHMMLGGVVYYQGEQTQQDDLDLQAVSSDFWLRTGLRP